MFAIMFVDITNPTPHAAQPPRPLQRPRPRQQQQPRRRQQHRQLRAQRTFNFLHIQRHSFKFVETPSLNFWKPP